MKVMLPIVKNGVGAARAGVEDSMFGANSLTSRKMSEIWTQRHNLSPQPDSETKINKLECIRPLRKKVPKLVSDTVITEDGISLRSSLDQEKQEGKNFQAEMRYVAKLLADWN